MHAHFLQTRFEIVINIASWEKIQNEKGSWQIISVYEG
jgi:hypothetical protein